MTEFFTIEFLSTFTGMVAFVTAVTQIVKYFIDVDPKWVALAASIIGQATVQLVFIKDFSPEGVAMAFFNIVAVLLGSIGTFEVVVKPVQRKIEQK